jgi:16S rRNA (guanine527-N7)-methyltransferase
LKAVFKDKLQELAPGLSSGQAETMFDYWRMLAEANRDINLTAITDEDEAAVKHFYDSIFCEDYIPQNAKVIDIGTGAGFPGIPLKIARPDIQITLLDSVAKKMNFVESAAAKAGVRAEIICGRAEEIALGPLRDSFDVCVSRAVASLRMLLELCLPFVRKDGIFLAYKAEWEEELNEAKGALGQLGGAFREIKPGAAGNNHVVLVIDKIKETPKGYPRRFARILKNPL